MSLESIVSKDPLWLKQLDLGEVAHTVRQIRKERLKNALTTISGDYKQIFEDLKDLTPSILDYTKPAVHIGASSDLQSDDQTRLHSGLKGLMPWKKGPFNIFGIHIDAEWKSDLKWARIKGHLSPMKDHVVADIGCNNGYYMYRMLEHHPKLVVGFEPFVKHWLTFHLLNAWTKEQRLQFETLGIEHMGLFEKSFDTIFCLGILYHHTEPIGMLRSMKKALNKGGQLILDCQGIPGEDDIALVPKNRYTGARGFWFLPTLNCLKNMVFRAGFSEIDVIFSEKLDPSEQRSTDWAPIKSLSDFLDPDDPSKTIEGYPAPYRFYLKIR